MGFKLVTALLISLLSSVTFAASPNYYLSLTGAKEGAIYRNNIASFKNVAPIMSFNFSAASTRDPASGLATGKRQHSPVTIYKEMDGSSPLLMQMFTTNQILQATITAVETAAGKSRPFLSPAACSTGDLATTVTWKLTNGALTSVAHEARDTQLVEKVSITFQKMEISAEAGGKTLTTSFDF